MAHSQLGLEAVCSSLSFIQSFTSIIKIMLDLFDNAMHERLKSEASLAALMCSRTQEEYIYAPLQEGYEAQVAARLEI